MRTLSLALALMVLSSTVHAFDFALERERLQEQYLNFHSYPILIVDQDELTWRYLQAGLVDYQDRKQADERARLLGQYVEEITGVTLTAQQLGGIEIYTSILKDGAFAVPVLKNLNFNQPKYQMCMVFTASQNSNQRLEHERLLGLNNEEVYGQITYDHLQYRLPFETLALFSLYHELAHCLDQKFMPQMYRGQEDAHTVHLAENFAEGLATLMLHQRGIKNISRIRGFHRILYSRMMGRHFAQNPGLGFGHPFFARGGVIYHLEPGLRGAETFITMNRNQIDLLETQDLIVQMNSIVEKQAFDSRSFHAIGVYLEDDNSLQVIENFRLRAFENPHWFYKAYRDLLEYHDYTSYVISRMFTSDATTLDSNEDLELINQSELCLSVLNDDKETFQQLLSVERKALRDSQSSALSLRQRAIDLNTLEQRLFLTCKADLAQL